jgi:pimeloyl-ACP methyl ester carboxylesterase
MARVIDRISEQAVLIGKQKSLVGIITRVVPPVDGPERPAVVILNTGIIHRVGHHRMYVDLSRTLARVGHTVLRFDLSGIGDSESRAEALPPWRSVFADIAEVLDWLEARHGIRQVVLVGLCSGADHALYYGSSDHRVVGMVLMDPTIPPTRRYYLQYFGRRLFRLRSWLNAALGRSRIWASLPKLGEIQFRKERDLAADIPVDPESRVFFERLYLRAVAMRMHFLIILAAGQDTRHSYPEQLLEAFPNVSFGDLLRLEFLKDCDHTFSFESNRTQLTDIILGWVRAAPFAERKEIRRGHLVAAFWLVCSPLLVRLSAHGLLAT